MNSHLNQIALGRENPSLVLKHARVFHVFTEEFIEADVAVEDGVFVAVGNYNGKQEIDLTGKYIVPGFIDSHLHLETTMVAPAELVFAAACTGTTTFIVDPHEAANVSGCDGIDYILEQTGQVPANVYVMMPSCVPSSPLEDNGSRLDAGKMYPYLNNPRILGLGEVMDYPAVLASQPEMADKLALFQGRLIDGHAPFLQPEQLSAYALAGIRTDHECSSFEYALEECRRGIQVLVREGSGARNLEAIVTGIVKHGTDPAGFCFCTDDKHIDDIRREGHISHNIRKSISLGLAPEKALKMASYYAAQCYGLRHLGAVAPGYQADFVVLDDLESVAIHSVYQKGELIDPGVPPARTVCPEKLKHTVNCAPLTARMLEHPAGHQAAPVIEVVPGQILTKHRTEQVPNQNGLFCPDEVYNKAVVVERHKASGKVGAAPVRGFCIRDGAIASSVSHDSHNLIAVGDNDRDLLLAFEELRRVQGGYTVIRHGRVLGTLALPVMGLMSDESFTDTEQTLHELLRFASDIGVPDGVDPFITLSFLSLTVIPELRVTTYGMYDVVKQQIIHSSTDG